MVMTGDLEAYGEFLVPDDDGLYKTRMLTRLLCVAGGTEAGMLAALAVRNGVPWWMSVAVADSLLVLVPVSAMTVAYMTLRFICILVSGVRPSVRSVCGSASLSFVSVLPGVAGLCLAGLLLGNGERYGCYSSLLDPCLMAACPVYCLVLLLNEDRSS